MGEHVNQHVLSYLAGVSGPLLNDAVQAKDLRYMVAQHMSQALMILLAKVSKGHLGWGDGVGLAFGLLGHEDILAESRIG
jgi:hypothetical protein